VRIARHAGWTWAEAQAQPLEYLYLLAADAQLENDSVREETRAPGPSSAPSTGGSRTRLIRYSLKPKSR